MNSSTYTALVQVNVLQATNVLDRWICAASRSLTSFVRREMGAYRLYTVVPFLVCCLPDETVTGSPPVCAAVS